LYVKLHAAKIQINLNMRRGGSRHCGGL
jgi:hypothetical protein